MWNEQKCSQDMLFGKILEPLLGEDLAGECRSLEEGRDDCVLFCPLPVCLMHFLGAMRWAVLSHPTKLLLQGTLPHYRTSNNKASNYELKPPEARATANNSFLILWNSYFDSSTFNMRLDYVQWLKETMLCHIIEVFILWTCHWHYT